MTPLSPLLLLGQYKPHTHTHYMMEWLYTDIDKEQPAGYLDMDKYENGCITVHRTGGMESTQPELPVQLTQTTHGECFVYTCSQ